jgi:hypothetical protein
MGVLFEEETLFYKKYNKKYMKLLQMCQWNLVVYKPPFVREKTRHAPSGVSSIPVQSQQGMLPKAIWDWQRLQTPLPPPPNPPTTLSLLPKG